MRTKRRQINSLKIKSQKRIAFGVSSLHRSIDRRITARPIIIAGGFDRPTSENEERDDKDASHGVRETRREDEVAASTAALLGASDRTAKDEATAISSSDAMKFTSRRMPQDI